MTEVERKYVKEIVQETVRQLGKIGALKSVEKMAYKDASARIRQHFDNGENDAAVQSALKKIEKDKYYKVILLSFSYGYTIEEIAEALNVEVSTISRNKKRLCLQVYNLLGEK